MSFPDIMIALSHMYSSYDATTWLGRPRQAWGGKSAAELVKEGEVEKVWERLQREPRYKKIKKTTET